MNLIYHQELQLYLVGTTETELCVCGHLRRTLQFCIERIVAVPRSCLFINYGCQALKCKTLLDVLLVDFNSLQALHHIPRVVIPSRVYIYTIHSH
jgi:hypothetical protein